MKVTLAQRLPFRDPFFHDLPIAARIDVTYENYESSGKSPDTTWGQNKDGVEAQTKLALGLL